MVCGRLRSPKLSRTIRTLCHVNSASAICTSSHWRVGGSGANAPLQVPCRKQWQYIIGLDSASVAVLVWRIIDVHARICILLDALVETFDMIGDAALMV